MISARLSNVDIAEYTHDIIKQFFQKNKEWGDGSILIFKLEI